jgi:hypothetical protein
MRFQSERDQRLATSVISLSSLQMISPHRSKADYSWMPSVCSISLLVKR